MRDSARGLQYLEIPGNILNTAALFLLFQNEMSLFLRAPTEVERRPAARVKYPDACIGVFDLLSAPADRIFVFHKITCELTEAQRKIFCTD